MQVSFSVLSTLFLAAGLGVGLVSASCCRVTIDPNTIPNADVQCVYESGSDPLGNNMVSVCREKGTYEQVGKVWLECVRGGNCGANITPNVLFSSPSRRRFGVSLKCGGNSRSDWICAPKTNSDGKAAIAACPDGTPFTVEAALIADSATCIGQ